MGYKNPEGYSDPTAGIAMANVAREQKKLDYMRFYESFGSYEELREYTKQKYPDLKTMKQVDKKIAEKMPEEGYFQKKIKEYIEKRFPEAFVWKAAAGPYSQAGIPDICCVINGRYYGFEVKRPFIGEASEIQKKTIKEIRAAGGVAAVVCTIKEAKEVLLPERMRDGKRSRAENAESQR